jgi:hypothetical protein
MVPCAQHAKIAGTAQELANSAQTYQEKYPVPAIPAVYAHDRPSGASAFGDRTGEHRFRHEMTLLF